MKFLLESLRIALFMSTDTHCNGMSGQENTTPTSIMWSLPTDSMTVHDHVHPPTHQLCQYLPHPATGTPKHDSSSTQLHITASKKHLVKYKSTIWPLNKLTGTS